MKIQRISVYQVDLPLHEGSYNWSGGKSVEVFDSTIVRVETDEGVVGYGEVCPLGPVYLPAYAAGARTGIAELAPHLLGEDPTRLMQLNRRMDWALKAIDIACWDILGQVCGQPSVHPARRTVRRRLRPLPGDLAAESPEEMAGMVSGYRAEGYRRFQLKVGGDPDTDIERIRAVAAELETGDMLIADANTGWLMHEAAFGW